MNREFKGATISAKANIYFNGMVQSRTLSMPDGERITLGVILPGEYEFPVGEKELIELTSGTAEVLLPGEYEWRTIEQDHPFTVIANSTYKIRCKEIVEYACLFISD